MGDLKEKFWLILQGSGMICIIAFFIPSIQITSNDNFYSWIWGLYFDTETGIGFGGIGLNLILVPLGTALLLIVGINNRRTNTHGLDALGLIAGFSLLIVPIWFFIIIINRGITVIAIPHYIIFVAALLGIYVGVISIKDKSFMVELNKVSKAGTYLMIAGVLGYVVNLLIPTTSSWAYYYVVGPATILIGLIVLLVGLLRPNK